MSALVINGTTFNGLPNGSGNQSAWQPTSYKEIPTKIGKTLEAADGTRNRVERAVTKCSWEIGWDCNYATMQAIRTIALLTTTFTFSDFGGTSYTVQTEDAPDIEWNHNDPAGNSYWKVTLKVYQQ